MSENTGFTHESAKSNTIEWYTPKYIFDVIGLEFDLDVCSPGNHIVPWIPAKKHLTINDDGLNATWSGTVWCNPPYGRETAKWMKRMLEHGNGIALVFARVDTNWFHNYCLEATAILFLNKRINFIRHDQVHKYTTGEKICNSGSGAGSMLVAYGEKCEKALFNANSLGAVMKYHAR